MQNKVDDIIEPNLCTLFVYTAQLAIAVIALPMCNCYSNSTAVAQQPSFYIL